VPSLGGGLREPVVGLLDHHLALHPGDPGDAGEHGEEDLAATARAP